MNSTLIKRCGSDTVYPSSLCDLSEPSIEPTRRPHDIPNLRLMILHTTFLATTSRSSRNKRKFSLLLTLERCRKLFHLTLANKVSANIRKRRILDWTVTPVITFLLYYLVLWHSRAGNHCFLSLFR